MTRDPTVHASGRAGQPAIGRGLALAVGGSL